jgi:hypothetical protein
MPQIYPVFPNPPSLVFDCDTGGDRIEREMGGRKRKANAVWRSSFEIFRGEVPLEGRHQVGPVDHTVQICSRSIKTGILDQGVR